MSVPKLALAIIVLLVPGCRKQIEPAKSQQPRDNGGEEIPLFGPQIKYSIAPLIDADKMVTYGGGIDADYVARDNDNLLKVIETGVDTASIQVVPIAWCIKYDTYGSLQIPPIQEEIVVEIIDLQTSQSRFSYFVRTLTPDRLNGMRVNSGWSPKWIEAKTFSLPKGSTSSDIAKVEFLKSTKFGNNEPRPSLPPAVIICNVQSSLIRNHLASGNSYEERELLHFNNVVGGDRFMRE